MCPPSSHPLMFIPLYETKRNSYVNYTRLERELRTYLQAEEFKWGLSVNK